MAAITQGADLHQLRHQALDAMATHTGRNVIVYEASPRVDIHGAQVAMDDDDLLGFMEVVHGCTPKDELRLDLVINSPGGDPGAADSIASYLREKFDHIRVFVPHQAMSAATMLSCCADEIVLARHSFLGPIDMQFAGHDGMFAAAQDILDQFELIKADFSGNMKDFWTGPGRQYQMDLVVKCRNALAYGEEVAQRWLQAGMFRSRDDAEQVSRDIASDLANHQKHRDHSRRLSRRYVRDLGMNIVDLEDDQVLQDAVLTIHHCMRATFDANPHVAKVVESAHGRIWVRARAVPMMDPDE